METVDLKKIDKHFDDYMDRETRYMCYGCLCGFLIAALIIIFILPQVMRL
jgi:hypothetical protein